MTTVIAFIAGLIIGEVTGILVAAVLAAGRPDDELL